MNMLDYVIILFGIAFAVSGHRRGLSWVAFSAAGLLIGLLVGAVAAPWLANKFVLGDPQRRATLSAAILISIVLLLQGVGATIGYRARTVTLKHADRHVARFDSWLGGVLATISLLATSWFLGITFRDTQFTTVGSEIQDSSIIRTLDAIAPALPPQLAKVGQVLNGATFPNPFAGLAPQLAPIAVPPALNTPGVRQAAAVTSKVVSESSTCGAEAGSAWPIGNDYMATNAHVVAGAGRVRVIPPGGRTYAATVVLFDPLVDVAVLRVPGVKLAPLAMAREAPPRGLLGAAIGYPGGDVEASSPAAVMGTEIADSYDIYNTTRVTRQIEVLAASIIPGDSGGPVVDADGTVIGMTFATSTTTPNAEGYALTLPEIHDDLVAGGQNTRSVSTQGCTGN